MKFTEEQTIKFVLEYIKHECLLDSTCQDFKNKRLRKAALQQLSLKMNIPGFGTKEAYVKMRSLKSTYLQEKKKIQQSNSRPGERYVYTPNVKWFDILDNALRALNLTDDSGDMITTSVKIPNYVQDEPDYTKQDPQITVTRVKSETEDELWFIDNSNDYSIVIDSPSSVKDTETNKRYQEDEISVISKNPRKRRLNVDNMDESSSKMAPAVSKMADLENEFEIFGRSVAAQLKNMPFDLAIEAQMFIQKHLCEIRLKNLRRTSGVPKYDDTPQSSSSFI